jgi:hypothetical protein
MSVFPYILQKAEAEKLGMKFFYSGRPCKHGHHAPRYTSTHMCLECRRMHERARIKAHPEVHREKCLKWYYANLEKGRAMARDYQRRKRAA